MVDFSQNFIQTAGVIDEEEARMLINCGVNYLGFPLRLGYHKEDLSEAQAARIIKSLVPPVYGILITYLDKADEVINFCSFLGAGIVQLHGDISAAEMKKLRELSPALKIIKSLVVRQDNSAELERIVERSSQYVDAYITDTFDPVTGAMGATGKTHDWQVSRKLVLTSPRPVILAGGLNPANVREAILTVKPAGVDVHTGVENSSGRKDDLLVKQFVAEAKRGFEAV